MTEATFVTRYSLSSVVVAPPDDDTNCLTPKEEREIGKKLMAAIDRELLNILSGGYDFQSNRATTVDDLKQRIVPRYCRSIINWNVS